MAETQTDTARRRVGLGTVVLIVLIGAPLAFVVLSAALPDARDRLSDRERAIAGPVLDGSPICSMPLGRVNEVTFDEPADPGEIHYRCGWTLLGIPKVSTEAYCAEGQWQYPTGWEMHSAGSC